jgi:hypothetical protein
MNSIIKYIFILTACLILSVQACPQQTRSASSAKKNEKVKEENKRAYQKARKKTIKHRREIQTPETRRRMEEADKRADAYNKRDDKRWYQNIFKRKRHRR